MENVRNAFGTRLPLCILINMLRTERVLERVGTRRYSLLERATERVLLLRNAFGM